MMFNDRRTIKNPAVAAAAKAGSIKYAPKEKPKLNRETGALEGPVARGKERVFSVNRPMTKALVGKSGGTLIGREKDVKAGSKKATRLKNREAKYSKDYGTLSPYKKGK